jgi:hypothetical protein
VSDEGTYCRAILPRVLTDLEEQNTGCGARAMVLAMEETRASIVAGPFVPVDRGLLRMSLAVYDFQAGPTSYVARIIVTGPAATYGVVMELGRLPGKRGPSWRVLYYGPGADGLPDGWRSGWVYRKLKGAVDSLARQLKAERTKMAKAKALAFGGVAESAGTADSFRAQACFILARAIARKIHARGIKAHGFAAKEVPNVAPRFERLYREELTAAGILRQDGRS